ncbi:MAG: hypothetical protein IT285_16095 [Bdellovibrionales bacterium]|nr:hypothetical protein [Bdellovibrionales bacterium]
MDGVATLLTGLGHPVVQATHYADHSFLYVGPVLAHKPLPQVYVARTSHHGLDAMEVNMSSSPEAIALLRRMAKVVGGFLQESDAGDDWVGFQSPHAENAEWVLRRTILQDAIVDGQDLSRRVAGAVGYDGGRKAMCGVRPLGIGRTNRMKIEAGKSYMTRDGRKARVVNRCAGDDANSQYESTYPWTGRYYACDGDLMYATWTEQGHWHAGEVSNLDLVSEWEEPAKGLARFVPGQRCMTKGGEVVVLEASHPAFMEYPLKGLLPGRASHVYWRADGTGAPFAADDLYYVVHRAEGAADPCDHGPCPVDAAPGPTDRLQCLLYPLARDHMPFGALEKAVRDVEQAFQGVKGKPDYSELAMAGYTMSLAKRVLGEEAR